MNEVKKSVRWYEGAYIVVLVGVLALSMTYLRPHRVGVIDMDKAYKKLGVAERLSASMQERDRAAQTRFEAMQKKVAPEEKQLIAAFRAAQTDDQKIKAQADLQAFQVRFQKSRQEIAADVQRFQRDAILTFRERIRPHVQKIASRKRVDLVLEPEQIFQIMNNAVDLTDAVIADAVSDFPADKDLIDADLLKARNLWLDPEKADATSQPAPATPPVPVP
jgi:outer membrane protein